MFRSTNPPDPSLFSSSLEDDLSKNAVQKRLWEQYTGGKIVSVPVSGEPFFTIILLKTNVQPPYRLVLKPPIIVAWNSPNALRWHMLEISVDADVAESISDYTHKGRRGICVLSGGGAVINISLKQPSGAAVTLRGRYEILSIVGTVLPPPTPATPGGGLSVFLVRGLNLWLSESRCSDEASATGCLELRCL